MTVILTTLQATLNVQALPLKATVASIYLNRLRSVESIFKSLDARYQSPQGRFAIKDSVMKSAHLFFIVSVSYFTYGTISWLSSVFTHTQPLNIWLPFVDWIPQPTIRFWMHFIFEVLYVHFLLIIQFTNDVYSVIYLKALRTHITLLAERVSKLGENPEFNDDDNYEELIDCVRSHQELLHLVGSVLSLTIFLQFTVAAVILCVCMLNIFIFADASHQAITIVYYVCVMLQTLPACYQASMLKADSTNLPNAIFHCNWLAFDKRSRRLLIYFLHRAQEEISFLAAKLFEINLGTNLSRKGIIPAKRPYISMGYSQVIIFEMLRSV
uniref:Odorant receptor OR8-1-2 n=1 Tax=Bactrocera minax TaxID=104690 RepID=A0A3G2LEM3_9MUSC|nr:odorant receptor OR8-1-2 [Bactrocera minax]